MSAMAMRGRGVRLRQIGRLASRIRRRVLAIGLLLVMIGLLVLLIGLLIGLIGLLILVIRLLLVAGSVAVSGLVLRRLRVGVAVVLVVRIAFRALRRVRIVLRLARRALAVVVRAGIVRLRVVLRALILRALIRLALATGRERIALADQARELGQRIGRGAGIARPAPIMAIVAVAARIRVIRHPLP